MRSFLKKASKKPKKSWDKFLPTSPIKDHTQTKTDYFLRGLFMTVRLITAMAVFLVLVSCAPRFTVYVDINQKMNTKGITIFSIDTVKVSSLPQKRISYAITRDVKGIERLLLKRKVEKIKKEVDKLSR